MGGEELGSNPALPVCSLRVHPKQCPEATATTGIADYCRTSPLRQDPVLARRHGRLQEVQSNLRNQGQATSWCTRGSYRLMDAS